MFLAFGSIIALYVIGTSVMVGVVGVDVLARNGGDLTPVATVADAMVGRWGSIVMTVAAVLAFSSVANAGILSASRYPLAMGRDRLLPPAFGRIGKQGTPTLSIIVTVALILLSVTLFDPTKIAKLASAFMLMMFALACLAVIVMRESQIESYDPGFRSPLYPGIQILGILSPFWLIVNMGLLPTAFTGGLITFGAMWYAYYARGRVAREGAIFHVFERWGRQRYDGLDLELRQIMKERDPRDADPLDRLLAEARVLDLDGSIDFEDLATRAAEILSLDLPLPASQLFDGFLEGTRTGATPVSHGAALPHTRSDLIDSPVLVLVRVSGEVHFGSDAEGAARNPEEPIHAVFFLVSPAADPGQHLRILAQIARRVDQSSFMPEWLSAQTDEQIKEALFRNERLLVLTLEKRHDDSGLVGVPLREVTLPKGTLIAMIRRENRLIVPQGDTELLFGDRLTFIGESEGIRELGVRFGP
jgi:mannitol/fructose-specific phosphotransferase system IIA component (Ntr-type)